MTDTMDHNFMIVVHACGHLSPPFPPDQTPPERLKHMPCMTCRIAAWPPRPPKRRRKATAVVPTTAPDENPIQWLLDAMEGGE